MDLHARIHHEQDPYWADVPELPGVFAAGDTLDELVDSLREGIGLYLGIEPGAIEEQVYIEDLHLRSEAEPPAALA